MHTQTKHTIYKRQYIIVINGHTPKIHTGKFNTSAVLYFLKYPQPQNQSCTVLFHCNHQKLVL
jgi:hypothetical protein